jgi:hypothetical protein
MTPSEYKITQKKHLVVHVVYFSLIVGNLYKMGPDGILRRCVMEAERTLILIEAHEGIAGGHYVGKQLRRIFLELAFGGIPYTEMLRNITKPAMYAKELGNRLEEIKFL